MNRWIAALIVIIIVLLLTPLILAPDDDVPSVTFANSVIHVNAQSGDFGAVQNALDAGAEINARDEFGKTALHYSGENGHGQTSKSLIEAGADLTILDLNGKTAFDLAREAGHSQTAGIIQAALNPEVLEPNAVRLNPGLKYATLEEFESAIGQPGTLLKSERVWMFAPKALEKEAGIVHPYLVNAYNALYAITGDHTKFIIVVYCFPKGHSDAFGGTSDCTIWYDDRSLRLQKSEEWRNYGIPHVSGYIEEMAHNFAYTQFGWEMVGWMLGIHASQQVADNPIFQRSLASTRKGQSETFARYRAGGFVFPKDIAANQVDRIHAYLLWQCEQQYGPTFWRDFFREAQKERPALAAGDRDSRYRTSIECFDRLPGLNFKEMLKRNHISLSTDIKSMEPEKPGWNRRLE